MPPQSSLLHDLQRIVGEANAHTDRSVLSNYAWNQGVGKLPGPMYIKHWPLAVVMPGSTEEVAAVVKLCTARGLQFRALSTGNGATYLSLGDKVVVLDLVRMNRIVKIDRANQMAVVEPYVTAGRLQAEAMKLGLNTHIVGAGPAHSPLASATSFLGIGVTGSSTGSNARNMLALEWVTPKGEIVRIGSNESGDADQWFSEEGPGPGMRGMIRGFIGANSGLGVFTRIGYKLYPWPGPAQLKTTGQHPQIGIELGETMRFFTPLWQTVEQWRDASFRLNRSGVAFTLLRMPPAHIGWTLTETNSEYVLRRERGDLPELTETDNRFAWQILTVGYSAEHAAYQEKVVRHIVAETGGRFMAMDPAEAQVLIRNIVTSVYIGRVFRGAGTGGTSFGVAESFGLLPNVIRAGEDILEEGRKPGGTLTSDVKDGFWAWPSESRQLWTENIMGGANTAAGTAATLKGFLQHLNVVDKDPSLGLMGFMGGPLIELFGRRYQHVDTWMRRIKNMVDPANTANSTMCVAPNKPMIAKLWPAIQAILFSRLGKPLLNSITKQLGKKSY